jgi:polyphosphate kinase
VSDETHALVKEQYALLNEEILPQLAAEGIRFLKRGDWNPAQREWIRAFFFREVMPVITPIGLDPSHPFPRVLNKSLNFAVELEGRDAFGRSSERGHRAGATRPATRHPAAARTRRKRILLHLPVVDPA